jgi:hypothetical protein
MASATGAGKYAAELIKEKRKEEVHKNQRIHLRAAHCA